MSILKLEPGDKVNLSVTQVSTVEGKFGPQYLFTGSTPDEPDVALYLNVKTADQQFSRLGLSALSAEGQTFEIERVEKNGTKYTNINRPSGAVPAPRAPQAKQAYSVPAHVPAIDGPKPIATPEYGDVAAQQQAVDAIRASKLDALFTLYRTCFTEAVSIAAQKLPNATPEAIAAMSATIFIAAKDRHAA